MVHETLVDGKMEYCSIPKVPKQKSYRNMILVIAAPRISARNVLIIPKSPLLQYFSQFLLNY